MDSKADGAHFWRKYSEMLKKYEKVLFLIVKNGIYTTSNVENVLSLVVGAVVAGIGPYFVWVMS